MEFTLANATKTFRDSHELACVAGVIGERRGSEVGGKNEGHCLPNFFSPPLLPSPSKILPAMQASHEHFRKTYVSPGIRRLLESEYWYLSDLSMHVRLRDNADS